MYELGLDTNFDYTTCLVDAYAAPTSLRTMVCDDLCGGRDMDVQTARVVRISKSVVVANRDVVFVKHGRSFVAAYVWKTVAIGERWASLAQPARFTAWNTDSGFAVWELEANPTWILVEDMLDPCIFCWFGPHTL